MSDQTQTTREVIERAQALLREYLGMIDDASGYYGEAEGVVVGLQALLDVGLEAERDAVYELGQKLGRTDGIEEMRERCLDEIPRVYHHQRTIRERIRNLNLRGEDDRSE